MDVGIALPNSVPGATGAELTEWARRADARGFSTLGTIDRVRYDNYEPLTALAAAAAVTERIGLMTTVLLGPLRTNEVELAKQALSVNALSGGRFTLGIGLGAREDDYEISGVSLKGRGRRLDQMLERMVEVWEGDEVGPGIAGPPDLALGGDAEADARRYLTDYYAWLGEDVAEMIVAGAAKDPGAVEQTVAAYEEAGCDELILCPSSSDPTQVDLLADALGR